VTARPFTTPVAVPGNVSSHTTAESRAPLPTTLHVPILLACTDEASTIPAMIVPERNRRVFVCICVLVKK
jgi:hypothetical protein